MLEGVDRLPEIMLDGAPLLLGQNRNQLAKGRVGDAGLLRPRVSDPRSQPVRIVTIFNQSQNLRHVSHAVLPYLDTKYLKKITAVEVADVDIYRNSFRNAATL